MLQNLLIKALNFLGAKPEQDPKDESKMIDNVIQPVVAMIDELMVPIIIVLGIFGVVYGITLGVMYSRAESTEKRDEYKKRLINGGIGIVVTLILLIIMKIISDNSKVVRDWIDTMAGREVKKPEN